MIEIFTSFYKQYYDILANESLASWLQNIQGDYRITIYRENEFDLPDDPRIRVISWDDTVGPLWRQFHDARTPVVNDSRELKFAKKGLAWCYHFDHSEHDHCLWLDVDVFCIKPIDISRIEELIPDHVAAMFDVSTEHDNLYSAETGFTLLNRAHPAFSTFAQTYQKFYYDCVPPETSTRFYDGEVCRAAAMPVQEHVRFMDIETGQRKKRSTPLHWHWLGEHFQHFKAGSKNHYDNFGDYWRNGTALNYNPYIKGTFTRVNDVDKS